MPAFFIGTWQIFFSTKGAPYHRAFGYTYLTLLPGRIMHRVFFG